MAFAYCDRKGVISIGKYTPEGMLPLGKGSEADLKTAVSAIGRLAHDGKTWLVPGVPEAGSEEEAATMAQHFWMRLRARLPGGLIHAAKGGA